MIQIRSTENILKDFSGTFAVPEASSLLTKVNDFVARHGIEAYLVGGFVRDVLLGRVTTDIDITMSSDVLEIVPQLATALGGKYIQLDEVNRIGRVVLANDRDLSTRKQWQLDFSTLQGSIEQDLARRDLTINALAIGFNQLGRNCHSIQLIDPFNGKADLEQGIIRSVAETAFESDAIRLLRAVRLASELGFTIDKKTESQIKHYSYLINKVAAERVREELLRLLSISGNEQSLSYLDKLGLLTVIFPELCQAKGVKQPKEHYWDVFNHSLKTVIAVDFLLRHGVFDYADKKVLATVPWSKLLTQYFQMEVSNGSTRRVLLKLAALLHDVAKPQTKVFDDNGRMRFLGHADEGATITASVLERLKFSAKETKTVSSIVKHHLRPTQMSQDELPSHRAIYRFFRDTGETGIDILFLSLADHLAARGPNLHLAQWQEHTRMIEYVISRHFEQERLSSPPRLVSGNDLINVFGMTPGPDIGKILEEVQEVQASGGMTTQQEALVYIHNHLLPGRIMSND